MSVQSACPAAGLGHTVALLTARTMPLLEPMSLCRSFCAHTCAVAQLTPRSWDFNSFPGVRAGPRTPNQGGAGLGQPLRAHCLWLSAGSSAIWLGLPSPCPAPTPGPWRFTDTQGVQNSSILFPKPLPRPGTCPSRAGEQVGVHTASSHIQLHKS